MGRQQIARAVWEVIGSILPSVSEEEKQGHKHLKDLGADSVDRVEILVTITRQLGINEPLASFSTLKNIDALIDFLYERKRS